MWSRNPAPKDLYQEFRDRFTVEARKLEHQYPHALKVEYRGS